MMEVEILRCATQPPTWPALSLPLPAYGEECLFCGPQWPLQSRAGEATMGPFFFIETWWGWHGGPAFGLVQQACLLQASLVTSAAVGLV